MDIVSHVEAERKGSESVSFRRGIDSRIVFHGFGQGWGALMQTQHKLIYKKASGDILTTQQNLKSQTAD